MKISKIKCPNCKQEIPFRLISKYFLHGTDYCIKCEKCGTSLQPVKEPVPFIHCFNFGFLSVVGAFCLCFFVFNFEFLLSYLLAAVAGIFYVLLICLLTVIRIKFKSR